MTTKTLTITADAYNLLLNSKLEDESFSEEIRRLLTKKKSKRLSDFFGILSEKEGNEMLQDLEKIKATNLTLMKKRLSDEGFR